MEPSSIRTRAVLESAWRDPPPNSVLKALVFSNRSTFVPSNFCRWVRGRSRGRRRFSGDATEMVQRWGGAVCWVAEQLSLEADMGGIPAVCHVAPVWPTDDASNADRSYARTDVTGARLRSGLSPVARRVLFASLIFFLFDAVGLLFLAWTASQQTGCCASAGKQRRSIVVAIVVFMIVLPPILCYGLAHLGRSPSFFLELDVCGVVAAESFYLPHAGGSCRLRPVDNTNGDNIEVVALSPERVFRTFVAWWLNDESWNLPSISSAAFVGLQCCFYVEGGTMVLEHEDRLFRHLTVGTVLHVHQIGGLHCVALERTFPCGSAGKIVIGIGDSQYSFAMRDRQRERLMETLVADYCDRLPGGGGVICQERESIGRRSEDSAQQESNGSTNERRAPERDHDADCETGGIGGSISRSSLTRPTVEVKSKVRDTSEQLQGLAFLVVGSVLTIYLKIVPTAGTSEGGRPPTLAVCLGRPALCALAAAALGVGVYHLACSVRCLRQARVVYFRDGLKMRAFTCSFRGFRLDRMFPLCLRRRCPCWLSLGFYHRRQRVAESNASEAPVEVIYGRPDTDSLPPPLLHDFFLTPKAEQALFADLVDTRTRPEVELELAPMIR
eukprot:TRINITY_DN55662_c0_g1_i1.p1 TRINITY_DN55662_c0_g1~~TRINITY_DN55662_c0_g1_i1.p1  ORF type:complete len:613 (-),score=55.07 TRINITY_DN55662_c0_g1_i1:88-1926(-)